MQTHSSCKARVERYASFRRCSVGLRQWRLGSGSRISSTPRCCAPPLTTACLGPWLKVRAPCSLGAMACDDPCRVQALCRSLIVCILNIYNLALPSGVGVLLSILELPLDLHPPPPSTHPTRIARKLRRVWCGVVWSGVVWCGVGGRGGRVAGSLEVCVCRWKCVGWLGVEVRVTIHWRCSPGPRHGSPL